MSAFRLIAGLLLALVSLAVSPSVAASGFAYNVGFEQVSIPVVGEPALSVSLWYPSTSPTLGQDIGPYRLEVAIAGASAGRRLPLIVISHGTGGSALDSVDLAIALARAGFVVAALEHTGDNYRDRRQSFARANFLARPRQVSAAIDFLLGSWRHRGVVDSRRIGMFGHSAGGTTALIIGGGELNTGALLHFCVAHPDDWGCRGARRLYPAEAGPLAVGALDGPKIAAADPRVKALVVAAPALPQGFVPQGLAKVRLPVQLWVAQQDTIVPNAGQIAKLLHARPERHDVAGAGHFSFLAPCTDALRTAVPQICTDQPGFDRTAFHQEFTRAVIRFFRAHL